MKAHPAIRKTFKWASTVISAVLLVAWVGAWWGPVGWSWASGVWIDVSVGRLRFGAPLDTGALWNYRRILYPAPRTISWWSIDWNWGPSAWWLDTPFWLLLGIACIITTWVWRLDLLARRRTGHCVKCGYDRTGLAAQSVCPECGAAFSQLSSAAAEL